MRRRRADEQTERLRLRRSCGTACNPPSNFQVKSGGENTSFANFEALLSKTEATVAAAAAGSGQHMARIIIARCRGAGGHQTKKGGEYSACQKTWSKVA